MLSLFEQKLIQVLEVVRSALLTGGGGDFYTEKVEAPKEII